MSDRTPLSTIVFDVNETLLDITTLEPFFDRVFGNATVLREWFAELILYSQTVTLSGLYVPFGDLAGGVLRMVGENKQRLAISSLIRRHIKWSRTVWAWTSQAFAWSHVTSGIPSARSLSGAKEPLSRGPTTTSSTSRACRNLISPHRNYPSLQTKSSKCK